MTVQGIAWVWGTVLVTIYHRRAQAPTYDWGDAGFGPSFTVFLLWVGNFQTNYMYLYFVIGNLARDEGDVVRYAALLRGTESAAQAVSVSTHCALCNDGAWEEVLLILLSTV